ncbi:M48 family metalloprotease [Sphingomicrobium clamense]|uniref:M48 family metalloprotease n=1 Tax=Sphingomicrobium clamense TaxID=2851013 RepID=A0ABS6V835_9SPHN|nr:M48 family metalloprotease [Sphingomicrobium sp. B8]MBW0145505.1 M48 family metalloprotease [Sphingomicrobium sp. B8]
MRFSTLFVTASALTLSGCMSAGPVDPAISQQEAQQAYQQHPAVLQEFGGEVGGAVGSYVEQIGDSVAVHSGTPNAAALYDFTVLSSAVENAFAVPGGRIYITRQLMGLMDDEAELAFVLGHEVGHIAADHGQQRRAKAQQNSLLGALGAILGGVVGGGSGLGNLLAQGAQQYAQLNTLSYSRDQEYEADTLGLRYMGTQGYDTMAGASMLYSLGASTNLQARLQGQNTRQTPEWARTHPLSENRTARAQQQAQQMGTAGGMRNRDQFLSRVDGLVVDDDPEQGIIDGRNFIHPDLRLQFTVPTGYRMSNGTRQVSISGSSGQAIFSTGQYNGNLNTYIAQVYQSVVGQNSNQLRIPTPQQTTINGKRAAYTTARVPTQSGAVDLSVVAYEWGGDRAYHFATITQAGAGLRPFSSMVQSLRQISSQEAAAIRPRVIDVVTVRSGDTMQSLASRMAYRNYQLERFMVLNSLNQNSRLQAGDKVKLVVYGSR